MSNNNGILKWNETVINELLSGKCVMHILLYSFAHFLQFAIKQNTIINRISPKETTCCIINYVDVKNSKKPKEKFGNKSIMDSDTVPGSLWSQITKFEPRVDIVRQEFSS